MYILIGLFGKILCCGSIALL